MVKVISTSVKPSTGFISKPANTVKDTIVKIPSNTYNNSNATNHQFTTAMGNGTTQVINNVSVDTHSLATAMSHHNQGVLSAVNTNTNLLRNALAASSRDTARSVDSLTNALRSNLERNNQITRDVIENNSKSLSRSLDDISKSVDKSLNRFIEAQDEGRKEFESFARDFTSDFWQNLLDLLGWEGFDIRDALDDNIIEPIILAIRYLSSRIQNFQQVIDKLGDGEYESLDDLMKDLFDGLQAESFSEFLLFTLGLVPLGFSLFRASFAKEYVALQQLANAESNPNIPTWMELITAMRREVIEIPDAMNLLRKSGWSEDLINTLIHLSANIPNLNEAFELFRRGLIEEEDLDKLITDNNFNQNWVEQLKQLAFYIPTAQDVIRFSARDVFDQELAELSGIFEGWDNPEYLKYTRQAGIKDEDARLYWGAHWFLPSVQQGYQMLQRGHINETELAALFRAADIAPAWREKLLAISYNPITRVDNRRMFISGDITQEQMENNIRAQGYNEENTRMLSNWYQAEKRRSESGSTQGRELTQSVIIQAFKAGIYNINQAAQALVDIGYSSTDASTLLLLANSEQALINERDYLDKQRLRNRNVVEKAYMNRLIGRNEAKQAFVNSGLNQLQSDTLLNMLDTEYELEYKSNIVQQVQKLYVGYEIDESRLRVILGSYGFANSEIEAIISNLKPLRDLRYRDLTTAQINKAVQLDEYDKEWAINQFRGNGFSDADIEVIGRLEGWWISQ